MDENRAGPISFFSNFSFPPQAGDARIAGELGAGEADALAGEFAERLDTRSGEPDAPGLAVHRFWLREGKARKHGDIRAFGRIAHRLIANGIDLGLPCGVSQRL